MARFLACSWRGLDGGRRLSNCDSTPQCIAWLVVCHAFCLGDDRTDVLRRNAWRVLDAGIATVMLVLAATLLFGV